MSRKRREAEERKRRLTPKKNAPPRGLEADTHGLRTGGSWKQSEGEKPMTTMTVEALKVKLEQYGAQAAATVAPKPQLRVTVERMDDDGHAWLRGDVDFLFDESDEKAAAAAERAMREADRLIQADEHIESDEQGFGGGMMGLSVTVNLE